MMAKKESIICVIGDSFAGHRSNSKFKEYASHDWSWVNQLQGQCYKLTGESFPGQSFWHQRRWYFKNQNGHRYAHETILIFCHTEWSRLPHIKDLPINAYLLKDDYDPNNSDFLKFDSTGDLTKLVKDFYLSELFVNDFYAYAWLSWLAELPKITKNYKKVIHFFGFNNGLDVLPKVGLQRSLADLVNDNSVVVLTPLRSLVQAERGNHQWGGRDLGPDRANHFNQHNNNCMFEEIMHIIKHVPGGSVREIDITNWNLKDKTQIEKIKLHKDAQ